MGMRWAVLLEIILIFLSPDRQLEGPLALEKTLLR